MKRVDEHWKRPVRSRRPLFSVGDRYTGINPSINRNTRQEARTTVTLLSQRQCGCLDQSFEFTRTALLHFKALNCYRFTKEKIEQRRSIRRLLLSRFCRLNSQKLVLITKCLLKASFIKKPAQQQVQREEWKCFQSTPRP